MKRLSSILFSTIIGMGAMMPEAQAAYPAAGDFDGHYKFSASLQLQDNSLNGRISGNFEFDIATTLYNVEIQNFLLPAIYTDYDAEKGTLKLKTNYGSIAGKNLGFADADATWTGMGQLYGTLLEWQVQQDGSLTIPDFTLLDLNNGNRVVARFSDCKATLDAEYQPDDPGKDDANSFKGVYVFRGRQTAYTAAEFDPGDEYREQSGVTQNYELRFSINEYNQIWDFDGYSLLPAHLNTLRNLGEVNGNRFVIDCDTYNGVEWVYITEEDNDRTEAKLFGGSNIGGDWVQGARAFTLTKNADGTFSLSNISLWQRTMETIEGEGDVSNRMRVFRPIRLWDNLTFVSYDPDGDIGGGDAPALPASFDVDEGKITVDRTSGIATLTFRAFRPANFRLEDADSFTVTVSGFGENIKADASAEFTQHPTLKTIAQASAEFSVMSVPQGDYDVIVSIAAKNAAGEEIATAGNDLLLEVSVPALQQSGIDAVEATSGKARYFNLQGVEINNPVKGQIVIKIENGKAAKAIF